LLKRLIAVADGADEESDGAANVIGGVRELVQLVRRCWDVATVDLERE
jgi:hypothetical protein